MNDLTDLSPSQQTAYRRLLKTLDIGDIVVCSGNTGMGKTTLLRKLTEERGGIMLTMREFMARLQQHHPLAIEESMQEMILDALAQNDFVAVDDLHLITEVAAESYSHAYPRTGLINSPLAMIVAFVESAGKKIVFATGSCIPSAIQGRAYHTRISDFAVADYDFLSRVFLGETFAIKLDYAKIHRFAPELDAHQLRGACCWLRTAENLDTEAFIEYLRTHHMTSNVDLQEVRAVSLEDLVGVEDVVRSLEANIVMPLENDALAQELSLKPKRGVLLAGPPGTGKTTVGRALAHRLKSKFFLVDGTVISGTERFYGQVGQIFEMAKKNAPSIIFIDDSDVIFENGEESGLYRYLLTMLDGLESESAGRVCVMLTAMEVANLPPALMRSGRVELWLEMRLPDRDARATLLSACLKGMPQPFADTDVSGIADATEGFTGADLKRLVEDGKLLYAYDRATGRPLGAVESYFLSAVETVRLNKERYAEAEARARQKHGQRPVWFDVEEA